MNHYLAGFTCIDGEHEHRYEAIIRANDLDQAKTIAQSHTYDCGDDGGHEWDYSDTLPLTAFGDGLTACELEMVQEISQSDFEVLKRHGVTEIDLIARVQKIAA